MQALAADLHSRVGVTFRKISGVFAAFAPSAPTHQRRSTARNERRLVGLR